MSRSSGIEWTDDTWNPITGCDRVSPGCDNCYAMVLAKRLKAMGNPRYQNDGDPRLSGPGFGLTQHPDKLDEPRRWRKPRLIFVNSMSDLFHEAVPVDYIQQVFAVIADTPRHTYQVFTKRSQRLRSLADHLDWPSNLWIGVSVETPRYAFRIDHLREVPADVRTVSAEPLLESLPDLNLEGISWLAVGGESGINHRPIEADWVRDLRDQCARAGVEFFFKQWGGRTSKSGGRELDGRTHDDMPPLSHTLGTAAASA